MTATAPRPAAGTLPARARVLAAWLLMAAASSLVPVAVAAAWAAPAARAVTLAGTGVLNDVVATSATSAWAVGHAGDEAKPSPLIVHWNGARWSRVRGLS